MDGRGFRDLSTPIETGSARPERGFGEGAMRLAGVTGVLLGWRPAEFWAATPAELAAVLGAMMPAEAAVPSRGELARLMEMFPDG